MDCSRGNNPETSKPCPISESTSDEGSIWDITKAKDLFLYIRIAGSDEISRIWCTRDRERDNSNFNCHYRPNHKICFSLLFSFLFIAFYPLILLSPSPFLRLSRPFFNFTFRFFHSILSLQESQRIYRSITTYNNICMHTGVDEKVRSLSHNYKLNVGLKFSLDRYDSWRGVGLNAPTKETVEK